MITISSISGGKTSAYMAAEYPADYNVFALVRTDDKKLLFPDPTLRKRVEDKLQMPFVGTLEDDLIIHTLFDLEQYLGREITWVSGGTFDETIKKRGGYLPNIVSRYCTTEMKLFPIFYWWAENIKEPAVMNLGYRANEKRRVLKMQERLNDDGLVEMKATFKKKNNRNVWQMVPWQMPAFPLYDNGIYRDTIEEYWKDKDIRFAPLNNCVGCFYRNPLLLKKMFEAHPVKMDWFERQEGGKKGHWRSDVPYKKIHTSELQVELSFDDFDDCDSGYCGI